MNDTDTERVAAIRAEWEATTPGVWTDDVTDEGSLVVILPSPHGGKPSHIYMGDMEDTDHYDHADARFIAHAHEDTPFLLSLVSQLQARVEEQGREVVRLSLLEHKLRTYDPTLFRRLTGRVARGLAEQEAGGEQSNL